MPPLCHGGTAWREWRENHGHPVSVLDTAPLNKQLEAFDRAMAVKAQAMECLTHLEEAFVELAADKDLGTDFRRLLQAAEGHAITTMIRDALLEQLRAINPRLPLTVQSCGENAGQRDLVSCLVGRIKARVEQSKQS